MRIKKFGQTFICALVGGIGYEVIQYVVDEGRPQWKSIIIEVLVIAFIVTAVIMFAQKFFGETTAS